ncbi:hypothetical protein GCM10009785_22270 [Brooklawnia cerclae]|uniref:RNA polymerase sigma factor (Sigma-70 family) n=1 Tax=Brooklawnia cerclae TaxID=349934 RepID=A0ABX0SFI6_9ACTN|nr:sigma-70 family RNA polymerase sigma factor [Brooklawnia cerclae]NIH57137.1 RNA polymerase sigma factor (sigma-70 family) [Brooklawnia cerclae]
MDGVDHTSSAPPHDEDLVLAAADGDMDAAAEYLITRHGSFFHAMASRIAGTTMDPEDLLAEAITNLLAKWAQGTGPRRNVRAYVVSAMRNRIIDESRSPRSRVLPLGTVPEPEIEDERSHHQAELSEEFEYVRRAMWLLPEDQRTAIIATIVEGCKPRELVGRLGRPPAAIYSLTRRARVNLRRNMLRVMLEQSASTECHVTARHLPEVIPVEFPGSPDNPAMQHISTCRHCSAAWVRFASMPAALGVLPADPTGPGQAAE